ncbi:MAG TPA: DUF5107 domain-containing protein, partial [Bacillota bacterium]|nr:DUF5107 domain-containing protein [Bacillota bacterium]
MKRNTCLNLRRWAFASWLALATTTLPSTSQGAIATAAPGSNLTPTGPGVREQINLYPDRKAPTSRNTRSGTVKVTEENLLLPTYLVGPAERNPIFYTQESYQGAQKRVYPYPMQDYLTETRTNRPYKAVKLENQYVQFTILPEIGGRLFEAVDKSNGYDI